VARPALALGAILVGLPPWDRLVGRVTLTNPTANTITLLFPDNCLVLMRLYGLFDNRRVADARSKRCVPLPVEVAWAPGASRTFETNLPRDGIT
jgi:hypothetical protein